MISIIRLSQRALTVPTGGLVVGNFIPLSVLTSNEGRRQTYRPSGYATVEENVEAPNSDEPQTRSGKACSYCCFGIFALLWAAINIYMIIIGAVEDCSIDNGHIRVYLIVQGSSNLFQLIMYTLTTCANIQDKKNLFAKSLHRFNFILTLFFITWTIVGSVWVWQSLSDWNDDRSSCNNALFISAIICISLHYLLILLLFGCCTCVCWYTAFNTNTTENTPMN